MDHLCLCFQNGIIILMNFAEMLATSREVQLMIFSMMKYLKMITSPSTQVGSEAIYDPLFFRLLHSYVSLTSL